MNRERNESLPEEAQQVIDAHLDGVDRALAGQKMTRSERQSICDEIEGQIREMLDRRAGGQPTRADADAVIAELDPPEAYGGGATPPFKPTGSRTDRPSHTVRLGWASLIVVVLGPLLGCFGIFVARTFFGIDSFEWFLIMGVSDIIVHLSILTAQVLGLVTWQDSIPGRIGACLAITFIVLVLLGHSPYYWMT